MLGYNITALQILHPHPTNSFSKAHFRGNTDKCRTESKLEKTGRKFRLLLPSEISGSPLCCSPHLLPAQTSPPFPGLSQRTKTPPDSARGWQESTNIPMQFSAGTYLQQACLTLSSPSAGWGRLFISVLRHHTLSTPNVHL